MKIPATIYCLLISLSPNITQWDNFILTESLIISVLITWVLCFMFLFQKQNWLTISLFLVVNFVLANLKLLAMYIVLFTAVFILMVFIARRHNGFLVTGLVLLAIFSQSHFAANQGERDLIPLMNNIQARVIPHEHRLRWFEAQGMPVNQDVLATEGKMAWDLQFNNNEKLKQYREWVLREGRFTYMYFLVTHPRYSIFEPLSDIVDVMWYDDLLFYGDEQPRLRSYGVYFHYLFYRWSFIPVFLAILYHLIRFEGLFARLYPEMVLFFISVVIYVIGWLGDPAEITRHVLTASVMSRISCLLALLALVNRTSIGEPPYDCS